MSAGEWDSEAPKTFKVAVVADKWKGEDEEEDVKDNWDDDDEAAEDVSKPAALSETDESLKAIQVKKKNISKIKFKEKQEELKKQELEEKKEEQNQQNNISPEEIIEEKLRRQKLQEESDLELAKEAFGINVNNEGTGIDAMEPSSKEDFQILQKLLVEKLARCEKSAHYLPFLDDLFRELCINMEADDIKKLGSTLTALSTEKLKVAKLQATKAKKKAGSSKKASLVVGKAIGKSSTDYDDYAGGDDYDDFI